VSARQELNFMYPLTSTASLRRYECGDADDLPPAALSGTIEAVVREVDAAVPVVRFATWISVFAESIRRPRLLAQLLGAFAGLALLLAAIGS